MVINRILRLGFAGTLPAESTRSQCCFCQTFGCLQYVFCKVGPLPLRQANSLRCQVNTKHQCTDQAPATRTFLFFSAVAVLWFCKWRVSWVTNYRVNVWEFRSLTHMCAADTLIPFKNVKEHHSLTLSGGSFRLPTLGSQGVNHNRLNSFQTKPSLCAPASYKNTEASKGRPPLFSAFSGLKLSTLPTTAIWLFLSEPALAVIKDSHEVVGQRNSSVFLLTAQLYAGVL